MMTTSLPTGSLHNRSPVMILSSIVPIDEIPRYANESDETDDDPYPQVIQLLPLKRTNSSTNSSFSVDWIDASKAPIRRNSTISTTASDIAPSISLLTSCVVEDHEREQPQKQQQVDLQQQQAGQQQRERERERSLIGRKSLSITSTGTARSCSTTTTVGTTSSGYKGEVESATMLSLSRVPTFNSALDFMPADDHHIAADGDDGDDYHPPMQDYAHTEDNTTMNDHHLYQQQQQQQQQQQEEGPVILLTAIDSNSNTPLRSQGSSMGIGGGHIAGQRLYPDDDEDIFAYADEGEHTMVGARKMSHHGEQDDDQEEEGEDVDDDETAHSEGEGEVVQQLQQQAQHKLQENANPQHPSLKDYDNMHEVIVDDDFDSDPESNILDRLSAKKRRRIIASEKENVLNKTTMSSSNKSVIDVSTPPVPTQVNVNDTKTSQRDTQRNRESERDDRDFTFPAPSRPIVSHSTHSSPPRYQPLVLSQKKHAPSSSSSSLPSQVNGGSPPLPKSSIASLASQQVPPLSQKNTQKAYQQMTFSQRLQSQVQQELKATQQHQHSPPTSSNTTQQRTGKGSVTIGGVTHQSPIRPLERTSAFKNPSTSSSFNASPSTAAAISAALLMKPSNNKAGDTVSFDESAPLVSRLPSLYDHQQSFDPTIERLCADNQLYGHTQQQAGSYKHNTDSFFSMSMTPEEEDDNGLLLTQVSQVPLTQIGNTRDYGNDDDDSMLLPPTSSKDKSSSNLQTTTVVDRKSASSSSSVPPPSPPSASSSRDPSPTGIAPEAMKRLLELLGKAQKKTVEIDGVVFDLTSGEFTEAKKQSSSSSSSPVPPNHNNNNKKEPTIDPSKFLLFSQQGTKRRLQHGQQPAVDEWLEPVVKPKKMKQLTLDGSILKE